MKPLWSRRPESPPDTAGLRLYAIGDVHGRFDLLTELLRRIERDASVRPAAETRLVMLGDYIDRGPQSREVCELLHALSLEGRAICLRGNHDQTLLDVLDGDHEALRFWLDYGGDATLRSWGVPEDAIEQGCRNVAEAERLAAALRDRMAPGIIDWLRGLPACHVQGSYLFVHAGIRPGVPLDRQEEADLLWIRQPFLTSEARHPWKVVHGHSVTDGVDHRPNRIGIDTGAYRTGVLTALGLERDGCWTLRTGGA